MAQLILNVDNSQVARLIAAYGVSSQAELKTAIIRQIKNQINAYESAIANNAETQKIEAARRAAETAVQTARTAAESEIVLS